MQLQITIFLATFYDKRRKNTTITPLFSDYHCALWHRENRAEGISVMSLLNIIVFWVWSILFYSVLAHIIIFWVWSILLYSGSGLSCFILSWHTLLYFGSGPYYCILSLVYVVFCSGTHFYILGLVLIIVFWV